MEGTRYHHRDHPERLGTTLAQRAGPGRLGTTNSFARYWAPSPIEKDVRQGAVHLQVSFFVLEETCAYHMTIA